MLSPRKSPGHGQAAALYGLSMGFNNWGLHGNETDEAVQTHPAHCPKRSDLGLSTFVAEKRAGNGVQDSAPVITAPLCQACSLRKPCHTFRRPCALPPDGLEGKGTIYRFKKHCLHLSLSPLEWI